MSSPPTHLEHSEPTPGDVVAANVDVEYSPEARSGFSFHALFQKQSNEAFFREALDKYGHDGAIDPEAERRLVKKLDRTIIPLCVGRRSLFSAERQKAGSKLMSARLLPPSQDRNLLPLVLQVDLSLRPRSATVQNADLLPSCGLLLSVQTSTRPPSRTRPSLASRIRRRSASACTACSTRSRHRPSVRLVPPASVLAREADPTCSCAPSDFGWAAWAIPANLLLQKSPPGSFLAANIFMWGVLLMAQAASKKFVDLLVLRSESLCLLRRARPSRPPLLTPPRALHKTSPSPVRRVRGRRRPVLHAPDVHVVSRPRAARLSSVAIGC